MAMTLLISVMAFAAVMLIWSAIFGSKKAKTVGVPGPSGTMSTQVVSEPGVLGSFFKPLTDALMQRADDAKQRNIRLRLRHAENPFDVASYYNYRVIATIGGFIIGLLGGVWLFGLTTGALIAVVVGTFIGFKAVDQYLNSLINTRKKKVYEEIPIFMDNFAALTGAGLTPTQAIQQIKDAYRGPLFNELRRLHSMLVSGTPVGTAWLSFAIHSNHPALENFVDNFLQAQLAGISPDRLNKQFVQAAINIRQLRRTDRKRELPGRQARSMVFMIVFTLPAFMAIVIVPIIAQIFINFTG